jgi:hypothetical protein
MEALAPAPAAVGVQQVLATIRAALSVHAPERDPAQAALQAWEQDAAPGFCRSLICIVEEHASIDEVRRRRMRAHARGGSHAAAAAARCSGAAGSIACQAVVPTLHALPPPPPPPAPPRSRRGCWRQ